MPDLTRFRPALWVATGLLLLSGLVSIPVVDDGRGRQELRADGDGGWVGTAPSTTTVVESTPPPDAGAGTALAGGDGGDGGEATGAGDAPPPAGRPPTSAAGGGPTPTNAPPPTEAPAPTAPPTTAAPLEDLGPPGDPGPATAPRPGTYRYKASGAEGERETTTRIEDKGATPTERRQLMSVRGEQFDADSEVSWRSDGVYVLSTVISFGDRKGTCDWTPDTQQLKLPLVKGATWDSSSTCNMTGITPAPIPLNRRVTAKVVELRRVRVAGQAVDVWAIEGTERLEGGGQSGDRTGVVLFSPKHGLVVSESGKATTPQGTFDYRRDIQNLDPE